MWVRGGGVMQAGAGEPDEQLKDALIAAGLVAHEP
jgi:hypothetical protein